MAKQTGILQLTGKVGNMVFAITRHGNTVRSKGSVDAKRIATDPAFKGLRDNNSEFGQASRAGKMIRYAGASVLRDTIDGSLPARLVSQLRAIAKTDMDSPRGGRNILRGNLQLLEGFELNSNASFSNLFHPKIEAVLGEETGFRIDSFTTSSMVEAPRASTHFSIVSVVMWIEPDAKQYWRNEHETEAMSLFEDTTPAIEVLHKDRPGYHSIQIILTGIRFKQLVNGVLYPLNNEQSNAVKVLYCGLASTPS